MVPAWIPEELEAQLTSRFPYIFDDRITVPKGTTKPQITLETYREGEEQRILGADLVPFRVPHGPTDAFGFRVGELGYVTDAKAIPGEARDILHGVRVLVLNALWWGNPHPTHFNVEEAIAVARELGAEQTYLTHLTHRLKYDELLRELPTGIEPAYDGLSIEIPDAS